MSIFPRYQPYKGGQAGFKIALQPLDVADWIEVDAGLAERLAAKKDLLKNHAQAVWMAKPETKLAQGEVLKMLSEHLPQYFPDHYTSTPAGIKISGMLAEIGLQSDPDAPLRTAAQLVDEDLCIMVKRDGAWHLDAACLCFPSHWSLREKFTKPMIAIHDPVPGFAGQMAQRVDRILDNLAPERPVWRLNWSLHDTPDLHLTEASAHPRFEGLNEAQIINCAYIRVERQTLRKLPKSGAILFTVRTYIDAIADIIQQGDLAALGHLSCAIEGMDKAQIDYKGLSHIQHLVSQALQNAALPSGANNR